MTIEQMRGEIGLVYPGTAWAAKVSRMSDNQVYAVYQRMSVCGKLDEAKKERRRKASAPVSKQLSIFDKEFQAS